MGATEKCGRDIRIGARMRWGAGSPLLIKRILNLLKFIDFIQFYSFYSFKKKKNLSTSKRKIV
jgi:hypothetical protein